MPDLAAEERAYYDHACNGALWPLLHYFVDRFRFTDEAWHSYVEVNERFADAGRGRADEECTPCL